MADTSINAYEHHVHNISLLSCDSNHNMYQLAKPMYGAIELTRARMAMECHTYSSGCMLRLAILYIHVSFA